MRLKPAHIAVLVLLVIVGVVVFAAYRSASPGPAVPGLPATEPVRSAQDNPEDEFLAEVLRLQRATPLSAGDGALPPVDADPGWVPEIAVENTEFDVGVISNREVTHARLKVLNRGKAPLKLLNVTTTCACTFPTIPEQYNTVPAGGEGYIDIALEPRRIPGFHSRKSISIFSNDPGKPELTVGVKATVEAEFALEPEGIDFGEVPKGSSPTATMILQQLTDTPVEIKAITEFGRRPEDPSPGDLAFSFGKRPEADWRVAGKAEYVITATLSPLVSPGPFNRRFSIGTSIERLPGMWCYAKAEVTAFYHVAPCSPARLVVRQGWCEDRPDEIGGTATVTADRPIAIADIRADGVLKVSTREADDGKTALIDVVLSADAPTGQVLADLEFVVTAEGHSYREHLGVQGYAR